MSLLCPQCASWKGIFDFGALLGAIGVFTDFPPRYIRICRCANEVKFVGDTPGLFALFFQKYPHMFLVQCRCASGKEVFDFGAHLGERGD